MNEFAIKTVNLSKYFDDFCALDAVSMNVAHGTVYGLVGPNGAGKTTLLNHISGVYRADFGETLVLGEPVFENENIKQRIATVPSEFYIPVGATIKSLLALHESVSPRFDKALFHEMQSQFDLPMNKPLRKFSKGMQKQTMLWLALASRPELLLLDEPMDGLDPFMRRKVWSLLMASVAENGTSIVVSSHNLRELEGVCDCLGIMHKGKLISEHNLLSLDADVVKVQIALPDGVDLEGVDVLSESAEGRLRTLIVRGNAAVVRASLSSLNPVLLEIIPLSLEELFLYELKGVDEDVKFEIL